MSERGSFTTEYMYNDRLFKACKKIFASSPVVHCEGNIISGFIKGYYYGEEIHIMRDEIIPDIQKEMQDDDDLRICVMCDTWNEALFLVKKNDVKIIRTNLREDDD